MLFYVPTRDTNNVETSREYFDHSTICGIDAVRGNSGQCSIHLANGRKVIANATQDDVAYHIANNITRPTTILEPVSLEL